MSDGNVEMIIAAHEGKVVQKFKAPVDKVVYDPANIEAIARAMTDAAFQADTSLKPVGDTLKASMINQHRQKLRRRIEVILNTKRELRTMTNRQLSEQLVEVALREVFDS